MVKSLSETFDGTNELGELMNCTCVPIEELLDDVESVEEAAAEEVALSFLQFKN